MWHRYKNLTFFLFNTQTDPLVSEKVLIYPGHIEFEQVELGLLDSFLWS